MRVSRYTGFWVVGLAVLCSLAACIAPPPSPASTPTSNTASQPATSALLPPKSPPFDTFGWQTDFSRRIVPWEQILSGGPPKDGIPAVDDPTFTDVAAASQYLSPRDPVILFTHNGEVRAYPLAILIWHEIVNDTVGGKPVTITFCPLCNASIVFDRTFDGRVLDFGTTGRLRNSDLIMYDRQTETWWQQFTGQGLIGRYAGERLTFLGSQVISFGDFAQEFPQGNVLQIPKIDRDYGRNPYVKYDSGEPFLYDGEVDGRLPATERVVEIEISGTVKAYSFSQLSTMQVINDAVAAQPLVIFHKLGTASALDEREISQGKDVGSAAVYSRRLGEQVLTFTAQGDGMFQDQETGSTWNLLGKATAGKLVGEQLTGVLAFDHFWFAWSAFYPETGLHK
jgi:Protein of unknown function (DUF3179)